MNAFVERFNRTIQEEYTNFKQWDLLQKIQEFNRNLMDWLIFYNFKRPHLGLKKDYGQFIAPMQYLKQYHQMSHMRWTGHAYPMLPNPLIQELAFRQFS